MLDETLAAAILCSPLRSGRRPLCARRRQACASPPVGLNSRAAPPVRASSPGPRVAHHLRAPLAESTGSSPSFTGSTSPSTGSRPFCAADFAAPPSRRILATSTSSGRRCATGSQAGATTRPRPDPLPQSRAPLLRLLLHQADCLTPTRPRAASSPPGRVLCSRSDL
jgi:hypothetical protein